MLAAMAEDSGTSKSTFEVYENDGELTIGFSDDWVGRGGGDRKQPHTSKSRDLAALQPPSKSNC